jgi:hypothetical protein
MRRLERKMEDVIEKGSEDIVNMEKRIEKDENEIRGIKSKCREIIVRNDV